MNKSEREELKRLAEAATPGKWSTDICQIDKSWLKGRLQNCVINPSGVVAVVSESDPDAAFIAAANPAAIQSLLAYVDRLEAQRDRLQNQQPFWLIERNAAGWPPIWLTLTTFERKYITSGDHYYTESAQCALKFHDKESADEYIRHHQIKHVTATEHILEAITEAESEQ